MVAMNVWPTDASDGSVATEARWRKMARTWAPTGTLQNYGGGMVPSLAFPNLTIADGAAWVDGHYCELLGSQVLAATANGLAVVRFDPAANTAELLWRDGVTVPAQSPTGTFEMPIAKTTGSALVDLRPILGAGGQILFPNIAARDLWANPPINALATVLDQNGGQIFQRGAQANWRPPVNAPVGSFAMNCPDVNLGGPAVIDAAVWGAATPFPYQVNARFAAHVGWGYNATYPTEVEMKLVLLKDNAQPYATGLMRLMEAVRWAPTASLVAQVVIPAGQDPRVKLQVNFNNGGGGGMHTTGTLFADYFAS